MKAFQIGLRYFKDSSSTDVLIKSPSMLKEDLVESFSICRLGPRRSRWSDAIKALESDPLFEEADFCQLLGYDDDNWELHARQNSLRDKVTKNGPTVKYERRQLLGFTDGDSEWIGDLALEWLAK